MRNKLTPLLAGALLAAAAAAQAAQPYQLDSNPLLVRALSAKADISSKLQPSGAMGANALFEQNPGQQKVWYVEEQKNAFIAGWGASVNQSSILAHQAEAAFNWAFQRQNSDGSFPMPTKIPLGRRIHSTAMFVEAAAHAMLDMKQSGIDPSYAAQYGPALVRSAVWLAQAVPGSPNSDAALSNAAQQYDAGHGHRPYEKAAALQEASLFATGATQVLLQRAADASAQIGLSTYNPVGQVQSGRLNIEGENVSLRGVNPENDKPLDGTRPLSRSYDSSYQALGLYYAALYAACTSNISIRSQVMAMLQNGLLWESTRFYPSGQADLAGNTRVNNGSGNEHDASNKAKEFAYQTAMFAFSYYDTLSGTDQFHTVASRIARFKKWGR